MFKKGLVSTASTWEAGLGSPRLLYKDSMLAASLSMSAEATHTIPKISNARRISMTRVSKIRAWIP